MERTPCFKHCPGIYSIECNIYSIIIQIQVTTSTYVSRQYTDTVHMSIEPSSLQHLMHNIFIMVAEGFRENNAGQTAHVKGQIEIIVCIAIYILEHSLYCPQSSIADKILAQAPVPLTIFRSNSKFDKNWERSDLNNAQLITTQFCTLHDSYTVVACAKFRCDR